MSKELGEIIKEFKRILKDYPDHKPLNNALNRLCSFLLSELDPVKYIVEIERKEGEPGIFFYEATCNNKRPIGRSNTIQLIKEYAFDRLNTMAEILDLPNITIDQITFIEIVTPQ